jgi:gliding motility-associated protein GldM
MASGKLSPRQKMINMMYLVLMALLALNVSKEILAAFDIIRGKLAESAVTANQNLDAFVLNMKAEIQEEIDNEGKVDNKGLLTDTLDLIRGRSARVVGLLDRHLNDLEVIGLRDSLTGKLGRPDELERNFQYWMGEGKAAESNGGRGSGAASALRDSINSFATWVAAMYNSQVKLDSLKMNPADLMIHDPELSGPTKKTWELYTFDGPVSANLALLEALKADVYANEKILLDVLNERLGVATFKVDKVVPIDAPMSSIVPAGLPFTTRLYVAMSSSQIKPRFSAGPGGKIEMMEGGNSAQMTLMANGNSIPSGKNEGKQKYSASISVPKATGGTEVLNVEGEFTVRKPEVVITSATVQNLYRSCGNAINIDVPALGEFYDPRVTASNADVTQSKESKKKFLIVPTGKTSVVSVSSFTNGQTVKVGDVAYSVIEPPKPTIEMKINGKSTSGSTPVPKSSRVQVYLIPDAEFKAALPQDARYGITSIEVLAQLSLGPPSKIGGKNTAGQDATQPLTIPLGPQIKSASPGTKVYIRVDEVFRKNFRGQTIPDRRFSEVERTLSIVVQ